MNVSDLMRIAEDDSPAGDRRVSDETLETVRAGIAAFADRAEMLALAPGIATAAQSWSAEAHKLATGVAAAPSVKAALDKIGPALGSASTVRAYVDSLSGTSAAAAAAIAPDLPSADPDYWSHTTEAILARPENWPARTVDALKEIGAELDVLVGLQRSQDVASAERDRRQRRTNRVVIGLMVASLLASVGALVVRGIR
jgi:hypothetical protein